jgi:hypothetical protein
MTTDEPTNNPADDQTYDPAAGPDDNAQTAGGRVAMPGRGGMDTTMAAGTPSGAGGVANAELGTSGSPARDILSPEELAQTEVVGGAGLNPDAVTDERLAEYLGNSEQGQS